MRRRDIVFLGVGALLALPVLLPTASLAADDGAPQEQASPEQRNRQAGEDRWVPSLAILGGLTFQQQEGAANSVRFPGSNPPPVPLRGPVDGDDLAASPFVGAALQLMTPALPVPTRPRFFVSGEILPTFASDRALALEGDPDCARRPDPGAGCIRDEPDTLPDLPFAQDAVLGIGTELTATVDTLVFGASLGAAFPFQIGERQLRIKPSVGWIRYKVEAQGLVVDAACPPPPNVPTCTRSTLVETSLSGSGSQWFDGIGPGLELEMDAGRFSPLGVSLFLGAGGYYTLGDRSFAFGASDTVGSDLAVAAFQVEVDPWMIRAHAGIRIHWLGRQ
jgi:hypothetical protein